MWKLALLVCAKSGSHVRSRTRLIICMSHRETNRPDFNRSHLPTLLVAPLWYRLLCPMCPDRPRAGTMGTRGTPTDASTPVAARLGAERSPVQIRPPRLSQAPMGAYCRAGAGDRKVVTAQDPARALRSPLRTTILRRPCRHWTCRSRAGPPLLSRKTESAGATSARPNTRVLPSSRLGEGIDPESV